jgi:hypothetical protein
LRSRSNCSPTTTRSASNRQGRLGGSLMRCCTEMQSGVVAVHARICRGGSGFCVPRCRPPLSTMNAKPRLVKPAPRQYSGARRAEGRQMDRQCGFLPLSRAAHCDGRFGSMSAPAHGGSGQSPTAGRSRLYIGPSAADNGAHSLRKDDEGRKMPGRETRKKGGGVLKVWSIRRTAVRRVCAHKHQIRTTKINWADRRPRFAC